tara:strand:- start:194 stop:361 length:168 start_codon:yes stop_codon:yes gene_type:complete
VILKNYSLKETFKKYFIKAPLFGAFLFKSYPANVSILITFNTRCIFFQNKLGFYG